MTTKLVERYYAMVNIYVDLTEPNGETKAWGAFLESHPKKTYEEALEYVQKHADVKGFRTGRIVKEFTTEEVEKEMLSRPEDSYESERAVHEGYLSEQ